MKATIKKDEIIIEDNGNIKDMFDVSMAICSIAKLHKEVFNNADVNIVNTDVNKILAEIK